MKFKHLLIFILISSIIALASAYIGEFWFDLEPCKLCNYQRVIYFGLILVCSGFYFLKYHPINLAVVSLIILAGIGLSFFHVGVEQKWFRYESGCITNFTNSLSYEGFKDMIGQNPVISCDQPLFEFMGISLAGWNTIYSCLLLILTLITARYSNWFKYERQNS